MTVFIAIAVLLTLLALAWLVRPLLWPAGGTGVSSERLNASIYRDQLEALDRDLARGVISAVDCEASKDELQLRLLDDTQDPALVQAGGQHSFLSSRRTAVVIALLLPIGVKTVLVHLYKLFIIHTYFFPLYELKYLTQSYIFSE